MNNLTSFSDLTLEYDVDAVENAGLIEDGWIDEFPNDSSPYTSTIVFLVRKGLPAEQDGIICILMKLRELQEIIIIAHQMRIF